MRIDSLALAATAQIESEFGAGIHHESSHASYLGVFQMSKIAYAEALQQIHEWDPEIYQGMVDESVSGRRDPANEAVAALGYLIYLNEALVRNGVFHPKIIDIRGAYNFGATPGAEIAKADDATKMRKFVKVHSLTSNGLKEEITVGEWRQRIMIKIGFQVANTVVCY